MTASLPKRPTDMRSLGALTQEGQSFFWKRQTKLRNRFFPMWFSWDTMGLELSQLSLPVAWRKPDHTEREGSQPTDGVEPRNGESESLEHHHLSLGTSRA